MNTYIYPNIEVSWDELHDSQLIALLKKADLFSTNLIFQTENSEFYVIKLSGVKAFRCENLNMQNIVYRIRSFPSQYLDDSVDYWIDWVTSELHTPSWLKIEHKMSWIKELSESQLSLLVLEPSVGAVLAAVCQKVTLEKLEGFFSISGL